MQKVFIRAWKTGVEYFESLSLFLSLYNVLYTILLSSTDDKNLKNRSL